MLPKGCRLWDSTIIARYEPEKATPLHHRLSLILIALWAGPAWAEFPALGFPIQATQIGRRAEAPADYAFPTAAFDGKTLPSRVVTGTLDQRAYRLDGWRDNTLALLQPLRGQLETAGYKVTFTCATTECGGFDFRFGMAVLPEPQMHIDLGDFRYLVAERGTEEVVSLLVSTALDQGFVQVTSVTHSPLAAEPQVLPAPDLAVAADPSPDLTAPDLTAPDPQPDAQPDAQPRAPTSDLATQIDRTGTAPLDDLVFASGKADLATGDYPSLTELAAWLKANPDLKVTLVGHTDATGTLAGNTALSKQRAASVRDRLVTTLGVDPAQLDAQGAGYLAPRATNQTPEGRQKNRRVEVMLTSTPVK